MCRTCEHGVNSQSHLLHTVPGASGANCRDRGALPCRERFAKGLAPVLVAVKHVKTGTSR